MKAAILYRLDEDDEGCIHGDRLMEVIQVLGRSTMSSDARAVLETGATVKAIEALPEDERIAVIGAKAVRRIKGGYFAASDVMEAHAFLLAAIARQRAVAESLRSQVSNKAEDGIQRMMADGVVMAERILARWHDGMQDAIRRAERELEKIG